MAGLVCVSPPGQAAPGPGETLFPSQLPARRALPPPLCPPLDLFKLAEQGEVGEALRKVQRCLFSLRVYINIGLDISPVIMCGSLEVK